MSRAPRKGRASAARDPMDRFHDEWLGMVRPIDGLVVAKQALLDAQVARPDGGTQLRDSLERLLAPLPTDPGQLAITDVPRLYADVLGLGPERWRAGDQLGEAFSLALPDTGQVLQPTRALVRSPDAPPVALSWDLPAGLAFDERETVTGACDYPLGAKLERLLRHTGVPIGLLCNGTQLRLLYAPHGASTGALTFRFVDMVTAAGKPLLDAFVMLLHARQWFSVPPDKQLPRLLAASRESQGKVTRELADQVLEALHLLLAGFEAADGGAALGAAYRDPGRIAERGEQRREGLLDDRPGERAGRVVRARAAALGAGLDDVAPGLGARRRGGGERRERVEHGVGLARAADGLRDPVGVGLGEAELVGEPLAARAVVPRGLATSRGGDDRGRAMQANRCRVGRAHRSGELSVALGAAEVSAGVSMAPGACDRGMT